MKYTDIKQGKGSGYVITETGKVCMERCFACGRENWAMAVASGTCAWCGHDANKAGSKKVTKKVAKVTRGPSPIRGVVKSLILEDQLKTVHKAVQRKHGRGA